MAIANGARAISEQLSFQNLEQIASHFKSIHPRVDVAGVLRKPYRRRRRSLYESFTTLIKHRHDIIHRSETLTNFTDELAIAALEDLEVGITRVYTMIVRTLGWHFVKDWGSGVERMRKRIIASRKKSQLEPSDKKMSTAWATSSRNTVN